MVNLTLAYKTEETIFNSVQLATIKEANYPNVEGITYHRLDDDGNEISGEPNHTRLHYNSGETDTWKNDKIAYIQFKR